MNKRQLHHYWRAVNRVETWHLVVLLIVLFIFSVWAVRNNSKNLEPHILKVVAADKAGRGIDEALRDLGNYISDHMNTGLNEPIQLAYSYDRAAQAVIDSAQASADGGIYKKAQAVCEDPNVLLSVRAACVQDYVLKNAPPGKTPEALEFPDKALFTYSFTAPAWSPDLAGWSLVAMSLTGAAVFGRIMAGKLIRQTLKRHQ